MWKKIKDPSVMEKVHLFLTITWLAMIPVSLITGWIASLVFVSAISIYANFAGHFASWQAARTEVKQDKLDKDNS